MSNPAPQKRKRAYRHRVTCSECKKDIVAEYQDAHARTKHIGKRVKFTVSRAPNQSQLGFMDVGVIDESEIMDKGNSDKSEIMAMENIHNSADNGASFSGYHRNCRQWC